MTAAVAIIATVVIHLAFYKVLRVPLPWGVLERWAF
jgi:putative tricarboxylic transport membrane protein